MKFSEFGLSEPILNAIRKQKYTDATSIQELCIPEILNNRDIIGYSQTGTGKTAAFALPIIEKLINNNYEDRRIRALILSPTRELAIQIRDNFINYSEFTQLKCSVVLGGVNQTSQIRVLKKGLDILVATPGRLLDLCKSKKVNLKNVEMLVLDEADTMLDMGFIKDVKQIIKKIPDNRQTMLFSATTSNDIDKIADELLKDPVTFSSAPVSSVAPKIEELLYYVDKDKKFNLLLDLMNKEKFGSTLIFTRTKHGADKLEKLFKGFNVPCSVIHGDKSQSNRVKALANFKTHKTSILIATDIASRGIDIQNLSHVINYDMPESPELYVHRIGRTARAGKEGISISFVSKDELNKLRSVEKLINHKIKRMNDNVYSNKNNNDLKTNNKKSNSKNNNKHYYKKRRSLDKNKKI